MSDKYFESGTVARVLGVDLRRLQSWVEQELVRPAVRETGRGERRRHKFSAWDICRLSIVRDLRGSGLSVAHCGAVLQKLSSYTNEELETCWKSGRKYLLAVGSHSLPLLTYDQVFDNPHRPLQQAFELNLPIAYIDTQAAFQHIFDCLAAMVTESQQEPATCHA
ncbi:MAG: MerR family transcriptional regulator [Planctomycetaceae bacterium]